MRQHQTWRGVDRSYRYFLEGGKGFERCGPVAYALAREDERGGDERVRELVGESPFLQS